MCPPWRRRPGSLDEVLPAGIPVLDGFDVAAGADAAWELLHDAAAAKALADGAAGAQPRTSRGTATAERLVDLFADALARPRGRVLVVEGEGGGPSAWSSAPSGRDGRSARAGASSDWCRRSSAGRASSTACRRTVHAASTWPGTA